jgi:predicted amidophosphoribosyltransferase
MIANWVGHTLMKDKINEMVDVIIPLHTKKERKRGYNQSQYFAKGISEVTKIPTEFKIW